MAAAEIRGLIDNDLIRAWPRIDELLQPALERANIQSDYSTEDILQLCLERDAQCWIVHEGGRIILTAITQIIVYPKRKVLAIPFLGGEMQMIDKWLGHFDVIKAFARANGCSIIRGWGRQGWVKVLKPDYVRVEFDIEVHSENLH